MLLKMICVSIISIIFADLLDVICSSSLNLTRTWFGLASMHILTLRHRMGAYLIQSQTTRRSLYRWMQRQTGLLLESQVWEKDYKEVFIPYTIYYLVMAVAGGIFGVYTRAKIYAPPHFSLTEKSMQPPLPILGHVLYYESFKDNFIYQWV